MKKFIGWLKSVRNSIIAATAVLVVVPALINSGIDVYETVRDIPRGSKERQNVELFQKHFKESPVFTAPLSIKGGGETRQVSIDVYENGDIFVLYGTNSQWFPFRPEQAFFDYDLIPRAYAQATDGPRRGKGSYVQKNTMDSGTVTQERVYMNGVKEILRIDKNTGNIISRQTNTVPHSDLLQQNRVKQAAPTVIDIDALKAR